MVNVHDSIIRWIQMFLGYASGIGLTANERLVYISLLCIAGEKAGRASSEGEFFPVNSITLAGMAGIDERSVRRIRISLEEKGLITWRKGYGRVKPPEYRINMPDAWQRNAETVERIASWSQLINVSDARIADIDDRNPVVISGHGDSGIHSFADTSVPDAPIADIDVRDPVAFSGHGDSGIHSFADTGIPDSLITDISDRDPDTEDPDIDTNLTAGLSDSNLILRTAVETAAVCRTAKGHSCVGSLLPLSEQTGQKNGYTDAATADWEKAIKIQVGYDSLLLAYPKERVD